MANGDTEYVFYLAGAAILEAHAKGDYDLWLLDRRRGNPMVQAWESHGPAPRDAYGGRIRVNVGYTVEHPGPAGEIHCVSYEVLGRNGAPYDPLKCLSDDVWGFVPSPAVVAVSRQLWESIPVGVRPLPTIHEEDYRLRLVARRNAAGGVRYLLGFHVKVASVAPLAVHFFDWQDELVEPKGQNGRSIVIDMAKPWFDPSANGHTTLGTGGHMQVGEPAALFVDIASLESGNALDFLSGPKVPVGGDSGARRLAGRAIPATSRSGRESAPRRPALLAEPPAVIISADHDDWLDDVRRTITASPKAMRDEASAEAAMLEWRNEHPDRDEIELVGHGSRNHVLAVGAWRLTRGAFSDASRALRQWLDGKTLRIVGCATAHGDTARDAICYLRSEFKLKVFGSRGLIGTPDLVSTGTDPAQRGSDFVSRRCDAILADGVDLGAYEVTAEDLARGGGPGEFTTAEHEFALAGLPDAAWSRIKPTAQQLVGRTYFTYPGLLQLPSATRVYSIGGPRSGTLRIDMLFDAQLLRLARTTPGLDRREFLFLMKDAEDSARYLDAFELQR